METFPRGRHNYDVTIMTEGFKFLVVLSRAYVAWGSAVFELIPRGEKRSHTIHPVIYENVHSGNDGLILNQLPLCDGRESSLWKQMIQYGGENFITYELQSEYTGGCQFSGVLATTASFVFTICHRL